MRKYIFLLTVFALAIQGFCDMGSIPFEPTAQIVEPNQRALIAWNGKEQILILSTDLQSTKETKVLEIMPLPSEPTIKKADVEIFQKATSMINEKLSRYRERDAVLSIGDDSLSRAVETPAGRVTFHKRIGAHDVSTTHVERPEGFVKWAKDYLKSQGVDSPAIPPELEKVIQEYINENFTWFVFNVISLSEKPITKEAIQLRFKTDFLFYPMRITRAEKGETTVKLLILSKIMFNKTMCLGLPFEKFKMKHRMVTFSGSDVYLLSQEMFSMLNRPTAISIRNWEIKGRLNSFKDDVIMGDPKDFIKFLRKTPEPVFNL